MVPADKRPNYVDGISGATLTGKYLSAGIREILETYEPVSIRSEKPDGTNPSGVAGTEAMKVANKVNDEPP